MLRPAPVLAVLVTAALLGLSLGIPLFGIPLALILLSWTAKHSIATLHALAGGAHEDPVLSLEMISGRLGGWRAFFAMLALVSLLFSTGAASFWLGPLPAMLCGIVAVLVMPTALLALGWTDSVSAAFDPRAARQLAQALGPDYRSLVGSCVLVIAGTLLLMLGADGSFILRIAAVLLGWLILVAISGATIHANRQALESVTEFHRARERPRTAEEIARERQQQYDDVYATWRSGDKASVRRRILSLSAAPDGTQTLRELYERARNWDAPLLMDHIAQALIDLDMPAGRGGSALRLVRERLAANHGFAPSETGHALELARVAMQSEDWTMADGLLAQVERQDIPQPLREAAQHLRQELRSRRDSRKG